MPYSQPQEVRHRVHICLGMALFLFLTSSGPTSELNKKMVKTLVADEIDFPPIVLIYTDPPSVLTPPNPCIILAVWADGTIVWSEESVRGGPPYLKATADLVQIEEAIARMGEVADDLPDLTQTDYRGPGSTAVTILMESETRNIYWHSWHEIWEASGRHVALERGIYPLPPGESVEEARAKYSSPQHISFVKAWIDVKAAALSLIPEDISEAEEVELNLRYHWTIMTLDP